MEDFCRKKRTPRFSNALFIPEPSPVKAGTFNFIFLKKNPINLFVDR